MAASKSSSTLSLFRRSFEISDSEARLPLAFAADIVNAFRPSLQLTKQSSVSVPREREREMRERLGFELGLYKYL